jgi:peptidoglycan/LPS O-acetylase OafA/YrhL
MKEWAYKIFEVNSNTSNRWYPMEGMRGLAVVLVFFVHYHSVIGEYSVKNSFGYLISSYFGAVGHTGVDLFFVLSGYLIYSVLIKKKVNLKDFYKKRIFRIYPTFTAVFVLYLLLSIIFKQENKFSNLSAIDSFIYIAKNFFLLPGIFSIKPIITVAWSLSYEIFFYLTTPIVLSVFRVCQANCVSAFSIDQIQRHPVFAEHHLECLERRFPVVNHLPVT